MTPARLPALFVILCSSLFFVARLFSASPEPWPSESCLSPTALEVSPDGRTLYIAFATRGEVAAFDTQTRKVLRKIKVDDAPLGLALAPDGRRLYVACAGPRSTVCEVDLSEARVVARIPAGHTAQAPVLSPNGETLYLCERFDNSVAFIDLTTHQLRRRVAVPREPVGAAISRDGRFLFVSNHIHAGPADADVVASSVTVIDTECGAVVQEIELPNGSGLLRDVRISPDGKYAVVAHQLSRFQLPTTQLERGWVNTSAITLIDVMRLRRINTVLVDDIDSGAANPWGVAWSEDGKHLCLTHAGTHELSVVDFPALLAKLAALPHERNRGEPIDSASASQIAADVPNDLSFLVGLRQRIRLAESDRGPRAVTLAGTDAWIANYFTDSLTCIDLAATRPRPQSLPLHPDCAPGEVRRGELLFNDAAVCFQGWQSCASCHSSDARVDGLNWDNLNDGMGNPKNAKSLLDAFSTPPMMWLGVRADAYTAVRAGIVHALFLALPPEDAQAIDVYLKSLQPSPSPRLVNGELSAAARRGKELFFSDTTRCADCHFGKWYTDLKFHDVGTVGRFDRRTDFFDTPTLVEVWRTAPYLHDGRAATMREVLTEFNPDDRHGVTSTLTPEQIDDLAEFVLSL